MPKKTPKNQAADCPARQLMESPVGPLMIGAMGDKICALDWAKSLPLGFVEAPNAATERAVSVLKNYFDKSVAGFAGGFNGAFNFEFDAAGTDFQKTVWAALCEIPYGEVRTYQQVAAAIGSHPRAVGGAVGANPVPILIPCHRVVGAHGHMTGYSGAGGIATKEFLLGLERG